ncbi:18S rRNA biogenesis protein RCL1 [Ostertagia ostertagi]
MATEELVFEGCNFFRQRLAYSVLSGRPVTIRNIRSDDDAPGIKDFEAKLIALLEKITNGTKVLKCAFRPGIITGGVFTMDCGSERCLSYFLEPIIIISPFCKHAMTVKLKGVTNAPGELSVDAIRATWLPVYNKFVLNDEKLELKISARGLKPGGGGCITFSAPIVKTLRPVQKKQGKICKIRGQAYVTKVTPSLAYRMIDSAKKMLHGYIADVYITVDQRKGDAGGNSPGYGLFLTAETTEGVMYHGEAISKPKGRSSCPSGGNLQGGGCLDSSAQPLASSFMALGQKDVSKFLFGPLTVYSVHAFRNLKSFFEIQFKVEEWDRIRRSEKGKEDDDTMRLGSNEKALVTALGIGFSVNITVMHCGLPLTDEVWRFFLEDVDGVGRKKQSASQNVLEWEWVWLQQVAALPNNHLDLTDPYRPAIQLKLQCEEYWIALHPDPDFPSQAPQVKCAYQQGFLFDWSADKDSNPEACSTLADLVQRYHDYCSLLDLAILQIKLLNNDKMVLLGYSFLDEDRECLAVQVRLKHSTEETIVIHVDWQNPTDFPRFISSTDERRFRNLDCDVWDNDDSLCNNLAKFLEEEPNEED